jgi:3-deoxy-D-manno-octulosonate 8-phosphate phosphatase (KDO 8-P phosphatase)
MDGMVTRRTRPAARHPELRYEELRARAAGIRLLLTDNDGVLTDTGVYYSATGEAFKRFSIRDGMAVRLLRDADIDTAIITGETSLSVRRRAEKVKARFIYLGIEDKLLHLDIILASTRLGPHQLAYMGDDVNDLGIIGAIGQHGLTAAPADAMPVIRSAVHYRCALDGGRGAFREFADWILELRKETTSLDSRMQDAVPVVPSTMKVGI